MKKKTCSHFLLSFSLFKFFNFCIIIKHLIEVRESSISNYLPLGIKITRQNVNILSIDVQVKTFQVPSQINFSGHIMLND